MIYVVVKEIGERIKEKALTLTLSQRERGCCFFLLTPYSFLLQW